MVKLNKIYTRTGDDGTTGLGTGERRKKHDLRVEAYGTVDEANAAIGVARLHAGSMPELDKVLTRVQNDLFDLGADLCTPESDEPLGYEPLRMVESQVTQLEESIDHFNADLPSLTSFVLPGGSPLSAYLHIARTIARRAERLTVALADEEKVNPFAIQYLNRLSDFLFVVGRYANAQAHEAGQGEGDVLWVPGANR